MLVDNIVLDILLDHKRVAFRIVYDRNGTHDAISQDTYPSRTICMAQGDNWVEGLYVVANDVILTHNGGLL